MPGSVLHAGAPFPLAVVAARIRGELHAATDVQRTGAGWPAELVPRQAEKIDAERVDVDREPAGGLRGVGVEPDAGGARDPRGLSDLLHRAGLVACVLQARDRRPRHADRGGEAVEVDATMAIARHGHDLEAVLGETSADAEDRRVLDPARHDATSRVAPGVGDAPDPERHRLRAAGCERDLICLGADRARHDAARIFEQRPGRAAGGVDHERVAVRVQRGHDRLTSRRRQRGGAGGIEVQLERHSASLPAERMGPAEPAPSHGRCAATGSRSRDPAGTGTSSRRPR